MLTNFFGKSNPINYLLLGIFIFVGYLFGAIAKLGVFIDGPSIFWHLLFIGLFIFSMLLLDFFIRKNNLTRQNTYAIYFFSCFLVMVPVVFLAREVFLANFFILLALRRIISLRTGTNLEKKILDASLFITVASLFIFWSLLLFVVLYLALFRAPNSTYKHLLIPVSGFGAILILSTAWHFLIDGSFMWFYEWPQMISFDFSAYHSAQILLPVSIIGAFIIWTIVNRILRLPIITLKERPSYRLIISILIATIVIALFTPQKTGAELLFVFAPLSIMTTTYLETLESGDKKGRMGEKWFKEILLWMVLILAVVLLII